MKGGTTLKGCTTTVQNSPGEIATPRQVGARNDKGEKGSERRLHPVIARLTPSAEAISDTMAAVGKQYYVYIMTNMCNTVLYVGVTNDLIRRVYEHKEKLADGFTKKYNIVKLVYYEVLEDIENAIVREKQIKAGSRRKKIQLVESVNKRWRDLYGQL